MNLTEYQELTHQFDRHPEDERNICYLMGLRAELGEIMGCLYRLRRDYGGLVVSQWRETLVLELGDLMWYVSELALLDGLELLPSFHNFSWLSEKPSSYIIPIDNMLKAVMHMSDVTMIDYLIGGAEHIGEFYGITLEEILDKNIAKLTKRQEKDTLKGQGDDR